MGCKTTSKFDKNKVSFFYIIPK